MWYQWPMDFCKRLNTGADLRLAIIGADSSRPARLREFLARPVVQVDPRESRDLTGNVDAVLLCTRDGREHAAQALPLLSAGISVWVDKPLATREDDAQAMADAATAAHVVLACRSGFRDAEAIRHAAARLREQSGPAFVTIEGPAAADSPYGGLAHYGIHHVEMACELAARPMSVAEVARDGSVRARLTGRDLIVDLVFRSPDDCQGFSITLGGERHPVEAPERYLEHQVADFLTAAGNASGTPDPEALVAPVRLLERILG